MDHQDRCSRQGVFNTLYYHERSSEGFLRLKAQTWVVPIGYCRFECFFAGTVQQKAKTYEN